MHDVRARARECLDAFVSAWLAGDSRTTIELCSPDVRWWTPLTAGETTGPTAAWAALEQVLAPAARPLRVTALAVDRDGSHGVVELCAETDSATRTTPFITSVVRLSGGAVVEGRTYTELPHPPGTSGQER